MTGFTEKCRKKFCPKNNINKLPENLQRELNITPKIEERIFAIFEAGGGILNVSEIIVGLYLCYKLEMTRKPLATILYRMREKNVIAPTGKKGEYILVKEEEV
jgi:hypothetical protein